MIKNNPWIVALVFCIFLPILAINLMAEKEPLTQSQNLNQSDASKQKSKLEKTIQLYFDGRRNARLSDLKQAFAKGARLLVINNQNQLQTITLKEYLDVVKKQGKVRVKTKIEQLEFHQTIAFARVTFEYPDKSYTDFLTLMKINNQWQIVNKSFVQNKQ